MTEARWREAELYFFGPASGRRCGLPVGYNPGSRCPRTSMSSEPDRPAVLIASGQAAVVLSGFFTSYNGQNNRHGTMQVDFLNAGGTSLGSTLITSRTDPNPWHQERGAAFVPVGTATLRTSLYGNNFNAYIDNVDVRVTDAANELLYRGSEYHERPSGHQESNGRPVPPRLLQDHQCRWQRHAECDGVEQPSGAESAGLSRRQRLRQWVGAIRRQQLGCCR